MKTTPPPPSTAAANNYSNVNGLEALKKDPTSPQAIKAVAQQIDALFLQMMLKSMRDASAEVGESASNEMGMYQDMFDKQISLSMSQNQGLGLGAQLTRQLSAAAAANANPGAGTAVPAAAPAGGITRGALPATSSLAVNPDANGADASESAALASSPSDFVSEVFPAIQRAAQAIGVNPVAMLAQAALETGWGKRMARNADGTPSRNLFGIKADDSWNGAKVAADTLEFSGGVAVPRRTAFRAYGSIEESVKDFARLLSSSPRYRDAVAGGANAQAYIAGIGKSGYATDPQYANKLNDILNSGTLRAAMTKHLGTSET